VKETSPVASLASLPNLLTLGRILLIVPIALLLLPQGDWARWLAFGLMFVAGMTDWLDGKLARARGLTSPLGRFLDPIADKLLVAVLLIAMVGTGDVTGLSVLAVILILVREILVSGLREYLGQDGTVVPVSRLAKWKTTAQLMAVGFLIIVPPLGQAGEIVGLASLWIATLLTLITGWSYLRHGLARMMRPDRDAESS